MIRTHKYHLPWTFVRRRRSGPTVSRNRNRYPEGCDQQSRAGPRCRPRANVRPSVCTCCRPILPMYSTTCRSAACAPTLPVRRGPISSQRCSSSGVGSVCSAARRSISIRRAMGDRGVDAGAACPHKAQPEIKSPAKRDLGQRDLGQRAHPQQLTRRYSLTRSPLPPRRPPPEFVHAIGTRSAASGNPW